MFTVQKRGGIDKKKRNLKKKSHKNDFYISRQCRY